jgi:hypothetical protein
VSPFSTSVPIGVQKVLTSGMVRISDLSRDLGDVSDEPIGDIVVPSREDIQSQCVIVDIQIIGRKPHASTGLNGWIGFENKAIRERSDLPHHASLPSI